MKRHTRRAKILDSLASSMIPMICSDILWQLPSTNDWALANTPDHGTASDLFSNSDHESLSKLQNGIVPSQSLANMTLHPSKSSSEALTGNEILITCLMELISTLAINLNSDFSKFIPTVIYPLVQKTNDLHSPPVQDAAFFTLSHISNATGYSSAQEMMFANYSYLMETLIAELSNPHSSEADLRSQAICFYSLHNIIDFMLKNKEQTIDAQAIETNMLLLTDMQASMTAWFNRQFKRSTQELLQCVMVPMGLVSVFISSANYLHEILSTLMPVPENNEHEIESEEFRWEDLLLEFEIEGPPTKEEESAAASIASSNSRNANEDADTPLDGKSIPVSGHVLKRLTQVLQEVLTANSTLLSLPNSKLQRKSCELFSAAFKLLSSIQHHAKVRSNLRFSLQLHWEVFSSNVHLCTEWKPKRQRSDKHRQPSFSECIQVLAFIADKVSNDSYIIHQVVRR